MKEKIQQSNGAEASLQKLIHSGKILVNEKTLEESGVKDNDFLVLMVSNALTATKPKPVESTANSTANANVSAPAPSVTSPPTQPAQPVQTQQEPSKPAQPVQRPAQPAPQQPPEELIKSVMEMGFPRDEVIAALRASFNNADRAVEYLMNGIPEGAGAGEAGDVSDSEDGEGGEEGGEEGDDAPLATEEEVNAALADNPLAFLRQNPQFLQMRFVVQQNPRLLGPLLEQIGESNPEVFQLITEHQEAFMQLLEAPMTDNDLRTIASAMEGGEGGDLLAGGEEGAAAAVDPSNVIQVTEEEKAAIERLMALGFDRPRVIEAYFACDKNETIAANFLFEHMNDEDF